jgi:hypothetical protein
LIGLQNVLLLTRITLANDAYLIVVLLQRRWMISCATDALAGIQNVTMRMVIRRFTRLMSSIRLS